MDHDAPTHPTALLAGATTTDDVRVVVTRGSTEVFSRSVPAGATGTTPIALDVPVTKGDTLSWQLKIDSPVDAGALSKV